MRGILLYDLDLLDQKDWYCQVQKTVENAKDIASFDELKQALIENRDAKTVSFRLLGEMLEEREAEESIVVSSKGNMQRILCSQVIYVESNKRTVRIVTEEKDYVVYMKMSHLEEKMPEYFLRTHQSYLVNINCAQKFSAEGVLLKNNIKIPVSRSRYHKAKKKFEAYYNNGEKESQKISK